MKRLLSSTYFPLAALFTLAFSLRIVGLSFGLPGTVFADEPHHINIALSFSSGNLDPQFFKYPTLWMYTLFASFGLVFLGWSGVGLFRTAADFAHLFVWDPTLIYLTARTVTALVGAAAVLPIYKSIDMLFKSKGAATLGALLYAVSPPLVYYAHQAKADTFMLFLCSLAWMFTLAYYLNGRFKDALLSGVFMGLAVSTQYTAFLLSPLLLLAHLARPAEANQECARLPLRWFLLAYLAIPAAFLAGSPFILIHFPGFWVDFTDLRQYARGDLAGHSVRLGWGVLNHFIGVLGSNFIGAVVIFFSLFSLAMWHRRSAVLILFPLLWGGFFLGLQSAQAGLINYAFCLMPGVFFIAGNFWLFLKGTLKNPFFQPILAAVVVLSPFFQTLHMNRDFLQPDTRLQAKAWIESNIPTGAKIMLDQPHTAPPLRSSRIQVERLLAKLSGVSHPRQRYFQAMLESHPGGGYDILRINRTQKELISPLKRHTDWSRWGYEWLDVEGGVEVLNKEEVGWVVLSSLGATPANSPRLIRFFDEIAKEGVLVRVFFSENSLSPNLKIYEIPKKTAPAKK